ncbi:unnamed protein product [Angiostrongylus costaricensis]|uniref:Cytochrome P450 n=1 Tax=Angiostrongylus costaricensis TaxID=334426 RepID=A0A0R3PC76_ANGCS|nr:unnamed protein product [Angiostrongylus costaricensis]
MSLLHFEIGFVGSSGFLTTPTVCRGGFVECVQKLIVSIEAMDPSMEEYKVFESIANGFFSGTRILCELVFNVWKRRAYSFEYGSEFVQCVLNIFGHVF